MKTHKDYNEASLHELVNKEEKQDYILEPISAYQRLKEHNEARERYNEPFAKFGERLGIEVEEVLPYLHASNRWFFKRGDNEVSVYLDKHEKLGYFGGEPYFEMYPNAEGDISRYAEDEYPKLLIEVGNCLYNPVRED